VQIAKGWYQNGYPPEKIYDVVWSDNRKVDPVTDKVPPVGNTVDVKNGTYRFQCSSVGPGEKNICQN
jgi:hypothetical protein